jgi:tRNA A37 threonylcarbamoyladenosine synthetase subunit TsaC/SUA5/YrdC
VSQYFRVHPLNPQRRLLQRAAQIVRDGGILVYPTDSSYAFGWHIGDKAALEKIRWIRQMERDHDFTLACRDLSDIATYARVDHWEYRLLRAHTPMSSTLLLPGEPLPLTEPELIRERLEKLVDAVVDGGACGVEPTSVIDLSRGELVILRRGKGDVSAFEA